MPRWFEWNRVKCVIGPSRNNRIHAIAGDLPKLVPADDERTEENQTRFGRVRYAADTWGRERRAIAKAEHGARGANPRYVLTKRCGSPDRIYRQIYFGRGELENRIQEHGLQLVSHRTS